MLYGTKEELAPAGKWKKVKTWNDSDGATSKTAEIMRKVAQAEDEGMEG